MKIGETLQENPWIVAAAIIMMCLTIYLALAMGKLQQEADNCIDCRSKALQILKERTKRRNEEREKILKK